MVEWLIHWAGICNGQIAELDTSFSGTLVGSSVQMWAMSLALKEDIQMGCGYGTSLSYILRP